MGTIDTMEGTEDRRAPDRGHMARLLLLSIETVDNGQVRQLTINIASLIPRMSPGHMSTDSYLRLKALCILG